MGHIRSNNETISNINFKDFRSGKPKDVRVVRYNDHLLFADKEGNVYEGRAYRVEKISRPLTHYSLHTLNCLNKIGILSNEDLQDLTLQLQKKYIDDEIRMNEESIRTSTEQLKKLKIQKEALK